MYIYNALIYALSAYRLHFNLIYMYNTEDHA